MCKKGPRCRWEKRCTKLKLFNRIVGFNDLSSLFSLACCRAASLGWRHEDFSFASFGESFGSVSLHGLFAFVCFGFCLFVLVCFLWFLLICLEEIGHHWISVSHGGPSHICSASWYAVKQMRLSLDDSLFLCETVLKDGPCVGAPGWNRCPLWIYC